MDSASEVPRPAPPAPNPRRRLSLRRHRMQGADFTRAYKHGSRAKGSFLTVVVAPNREAHARYGLSVGKRCWKQAVRRNRVRRVFREAFRLARHELEPGFDYVLIGSTPRLEPHEREVRAELLHLAKKALRRWHEKEARRRKVDA